MKFSVKDLLAYFETDGNMYSIEIYVTPVSERDFKAVAEKFRYHCRKSGCSWLVTLSSTDSGSAEMKTEKTSKRGRPRKKVYGKKVSPHLHTTVKGTKEKSAYSTCKAIKQALNKRFGSNKSRIKSKGSGFHGFNYIKYCLRQADVKRSGGDFDFLQYVSSHNRYDSWK